VNRFASVIFDADSTLAGIEGIDWLADRRGPEVADEVRALTDEAMAGRVALDAVYARRLERIGPSAQDLEALASAYVEALAPGAREVVEELRAAGISLRVVSGGLRPALLPMARLLGFAGSDVHAVEVSLAADGSYVGVVPSPLATQRGKAEVARRLALPAPVLAVGDGSTDLAMRPAVQGFAAYVGFVARPAVVSSADFVCASFADVSRLVLGGD
jgi:phosphoserine phosphatase